ncbi:hypothetical protein C7377_0032 [Balneicella halophila]|uniref:Uncharacterized protein n=1 Tax=Balneicella halophila TaxID=1537566 RepID=A0A7L4UR90_BALHA|nr:hypothetical protein [Balneicella halophila]PVX51747.1 hypothetical protein C7377_0032 [Balneicella halophila]
MKVFILAIILVAIAVIGLAISMIIRKNGRFPELHIGRNEKLKEKGITCATSQDKMARTPRD